MPRVNTIIPVDSRKLLVERVSASRYISKSARLRDLLLYLCERVLDGSVGEIHEQEVGHGVFGRPPDYDTTADNIVRVHASTLRKRLEQYFAAEGADEPVIIEIPKGNYAPVFHDRFTAPPPAPAPPPVVAVRTDRRIWILAATTVIFGIWILFLTFNGPARLAIPKLADKPAMRQFWAQVFRPEQQTDIVLDDAAVGLYQELTGRSVDLSEYFDRSYLRKLDDKASTAKLNSDAAGSILLKRQSSYASAHLVWKLSEMAGLIGGRGAVQFARDYSFHALKTNSAILLGNSRSNPWIQPFENRIGLRWKYDNATGIYYPVDTGAASQDDNRFRATAERGDPPDGYSMIALLPNLAGTGNVLIISGTGGTAVGTAVDFLADDRSVTQLRSLLPNAQSGRFPYFEALLRMKNRSRLPKDATVVICRPARV